MDMGERMPVYGTISVFTQGPAQVVHKTQAFLLYMHTVLSDVLAKKFLTHCLF
jgi:hypothetical protein